MLNVYRFHVTLISNSDRRIREETHIHQEGTNLSHAWECAERKMRTRYPEHQATLSTGHRSRKLKSPKVRRAA